MKTFPVYSLCLCLSLVLIVEDGGFAYTKNISASREIIIESTISDPLQILFQIGVNEINKENYRAAIDIFETLAKQTNSYRV